jgi:hypothetical protein
VLVKLPKEQRETRLLEWLVDFESPGHLGIGYAFYDREDECLIVLQNKQYHDSYAEIVDDLGSFDRD